MRTRSPHTERERERTPVILVPGAWTTAASFDDVRDVFEHHGHPTNVLELPARARRLPQLDAGGLGAIDRAIDDAIAAHDEPPILMGHSLGGLASLRASRRNDLSALILLMPAPPDGMARPALAGAVQRPLNSIGLLGAAISLRALSKFTSAGPAGLHSSAATPETLDRARAFRTDESWVVLASLLIGSREPVMPTNTPTLVVAGAQDLMTPTPVIRRLATQLEATFVECDVAHAFNEDPTSPLVTDSVISFLDANAKSADRTGPGKARPKADRVR